MTDLARTVCDRCRRPSVVCFCAHLNPIATKSRVLILQHPRERKMGIGTARMAHLALPNSVLRWGLEFADDSVVAEELAGPNPAYVLFPGPDSIDVAALPKDAPITLVAIDGTWSQAKTLLRLNPRIAALPRVGFSRATPSDYRIRQQPADFCVSTMEALAEALALLEPCAGAFESWLDPFHAMVRRQEWFETAVCTSRHRHSKRIKPARRYPLIERVRADWSRLVCVQGEANAWPRGDRPRVRGPAPHLREPEVVHWVAERPSTGERYEAIVAPRRQLAPATSSHIELPTADLVDGLDLASWQNSWIEFARPDDVLVSWGRLHVDLAAGEGVALPSERLDFRRALIEHLNHRVGTVEDAAADLGARASAPSITGRAGRRLHALVDAVTSLYDSPLVR
jgi:DTW domain-containing protein YfiP